MQPENKHLLKAGQGQYIYKSKVPQNEHAPNARYQILGVEHRITHHLSKEKTNYNNDDSKKRSRLPKKTKPCACISLVGSGHAAFSYLCFVRYIVLESRNFEQVNARLIDRTLNRSYGSPFIRIALVASLVQISNELTCFARMVWFLNS